MTTPVLTVIFVPVSRMTNLAATAMKNGPWQGDNGIITEGGSPGKNNDGVGFKCAYDLTEVVYTSVHLLKLPAIQRSSFEAWTK